MNQSTDPVTLLVDGIDRLQRELAAAHEENAKRGSEILDLQQENAKLRNTIQTLSERLTAALEAKSTAETESQRANEFVNVFRADMEKLAAENAELRREVVCESCGADIICGSRDPDDFRCRGCGKVICQTCVDVFEHSHHNAHGLGDPDERLDELRRDAERYRWLRKMPVSERRRIGDRDCYKSGAMYDAAIDSAMKEAT